jgi:hypothetical protein
VRLLDRHRSEHPPRDPLCPNPPCKLTRLARRPSLTMPSPPRL